MTKVNGRTLTDYFENFAPKWLAESGDPVGLQIGDLSRPVHRLMTALDVRPEVVKEAVEKQIDFIFAHHPAVYRPLKNLDLSDPQNSMYAELIRHNITVYAAHTNLDNARDGMNDWLAEALGLQHIEIMEVTRSAPLIKLNLYVPLDEAEKVRTALTRAGAGNVSRDYVDCSYETRGTGRFTPVNEADPTIGRINEPEKVEEVRMELLIEQHKVDAVIKALRTSHPYEVPVYELYPIEYPEQEYGYGRVGDLPQPMKLADFLSYVKQAFQVDGLRYTAEDPEQLIRRVAVCGGDAGKYYPKALAKGADVYITGDVYYHTAHDMQAAGLTVVDPGHNIEKICIPRLARLFGQWKEKENWEIEIYESRINTDPFKFSV